MRCEEPGNECAEPDQIAVGCLQDLYEERKAIADKEESSLIFEICSRALELYFDDFGNCSSVLFFGDLAHERGNIFICKSWPPEVPLQSELKQEVSEVDER